MIDFRNSKVFKHSYNESFNALLKAGLKEDYASILADSFAVSDCFGVLTHGSALLDTYLNKINTGFFNLTPTFTIEKQTHSFASINDDNAIGAVSARHCLDIAIERAQIEGVYTVFSRNNNTFGAAFYYSLLAAEKGYICFITSNSPAQMATPNGKTKKLGTNPFSVVFPTKDGYPIIVDMATSIVAKSKIKNYKEKNLLLPDGWALDENGDPTNDPEKALKGFVLPMAGFKGYAIALSIDIFAGILSGASYLDKVGRFLNSNSCMDVGFMITVYNPKLIVNGDYYDKIGAYIKKLKSSSEGDEVILPGNDRIDFYIKSK